MYQYEVPGTVRGGLLQSRAFASDDQPLSGRVFS
jgi:hypothetical protein